MQADTHGTHRHHRLGYLFPDFQIKSSVRFPLLVPFDFRGAIWSNPSSSCEQKFETQLQNTVVWTAHTVMKFWNWNYTPICFILLSAWKPTFILPSHCFIYVLKCYHVCTQTRWAETSAMTYQCANVPMYLLTNKPANQRTLQLDLRLNQGEI